MVEAKTKTKDFKMKSTSTSVKLPGKSFVDEIVSASREKYEFGNRDNSNKRFIGFSSPCFFQHKAVFVVFEENVLLFFRLKFSLFRKKFPVSKQKEPSKYVSQKFLNFSKISFEILV